MAIAGAITFVEPVANTIAHYFFDRAWERPTARAWRVRWGLERAVVSGQGGTRSDLATTTGSA